jgi:regulatory protein
VLPIVASKFALSTGKVFSEETFEQLQLANEIEELKEYSFRILSRHRYSEKKIRQKLEHRASHKNVAAAVLDILVSLHLINDADLAMDLYQSLSAQHKYSRLQIKQKLLQKGLSAAVVANVLADNATDDDAEYRIAIDLAQKQLQKYASIDDTMKVKQKLYSFLQRRGFSANHCSAVLRELFN